MKSQPMDPRFRDSIFSKEIKEEKGNSFFTSHLREHEEKRGENKTSRRGNCRLERRARIPRRTLYKQQHDFLGERGSTDFERQ